MSDMEEKRKIKPALTLSAPSEWDRLPDIGLYMDQVVTYIERELVSLRAAGDERLATPSMINNYAKANLIPRTEGKKYSREQIALLLSAFTLKQVLSLQDMTMLMAGLGGHGETETFYESFRASMDGAAKETVAAVEKGLSWAEDAGFVTRKAYLDLALKLAVEASLRSYAAEILLGEARELLKETNPPEEKPARKSRSPKP